MSLLLFYSERTGRSPSDIRIKSFGSAFRDVNSSLDVYFTVKNEELLKLKNYLNGGKK
jgi:hypothetical protein